MSLAVVFDCGDEARVLAALDNDSYGQGCARLVSALFSRKWVGGEVAHLLRGDGATVFWNCLRDQLPDGVSCSTQRVYVAPVMFSMASSMVSIVGGLSCVRAYSRLLVAVYHVPVAFADAGVAALLLVARPVVNFAHHQSDEEGVNAGNGSACVVSGDGDGCL